MSTELLNVSGIQKSFGTVRVLDGISISVNSGEVVGLLGENGAGKSTLMNIVSGALRSDAGTMTFEGRPVDLGSVRDGIALGIRFVHQELSGAPSLSIEENLFLGDYQADRFGLISKARLLGAAKRLLATVGLDHLDPARPFGSLRPGEQQLLEIAKAVSEDPKLLILDEPTSSLTPAEAERLFSLTRELQSRGIAVIFITHRLEEALANCTRFVVLRDGKIVSTRIPFETNKQQLIMDMIGKPTTFSYRGSTMVKDSTRLRVQGLRDHQLLKGIDLAVGAGEVVGLFGLVGAGRTEFLETIFGARPLRGGQIEIDGVPFTPGAAHKSVRSGLFMLPEGRKVSGVLPTLSVRSNISISSLAALTSLGFVDAREERVASTKLSELLRIRMASIEQPISSLSGGNQQKALFGRALMAKPRVLLLDEPTNGVDVGAKSEIYDIVHDIARSGVSVVFASSELPEILAIADRCLVFSGGRIAGEFDRQSMTEDGILTSAFG
jgi:ribose transport system ATP-binding protein